MPLISIFGVCLGQNKISARRAFEILESWGLGVLFKEELAGQGSSRIQQDSGTGTPSIPSRKVYFLHLIR